MLHSNCKLPFIFTYIRTLENTHGLSQKIQGTYFKTSALYFKIYGLYFLPFQMPEKQEPAKREKFVLKTGFSCSVLVYRKQRKKSYSSIFRVRKNLRVAAKNSTTPMAFTPQFIQNAAEYPKLPLTTPPSKMPIPMPTPHDTRIEEFAVPRSLWCAMPTNMFKKAG